MSLINVEFTNDDKDRNLRFSIDDHNFLKVVATNKTIDNGDTHWEFEPSLSFEKELSDEGVFNVIQDLFIIVATLKVTTDGVTFIEDDDA